MLSVEQEKEVEELQAIAERAKVDVHGPSPVLLDPEQLLRLIHLLKSQVMTEQITLQHFQNVAHDWLRSSAPALIACGHELQAMVELLQTRVVE